MENSGDAPEFSIESTLNNEGDELPYGFYNPETDGKVTWVCNYGHGNSTIDADNRDIISVFAFDNGTGTEKRVSQLKDMAEARFCRDELVKNGWKKLIAPKIGFTTTTKDGVTSEMNRKQKRSLGRKINQISKTVERNKKAL